MTGKQASDTPKGAQAETIAGKLSLLRALANFSLAGCPPELRGELENQREQIRKCVRELEQQCQKTEAGVSQQDHAAATDDQTAETQRLISRFIETVAPESMQTAWDPDSFSGSLLVVFEDGEIVSSSLVETGSNVQFGLVDDDENPPPAELAVHTFTVLKSRGKTGVNIYYDLPRPATVAVKIYDAQENLVRQMANTYAEAGAYTVAWDGLNDDGDPMPPGHYYCRVRTGNIESELKEIDLR